jgi:hypothetical protein
MNRKRSGFSLVLSLAIMAGMVMMVIVLAAFLQVETRLALGHSGYMRARLNAIASAKMALGQLQQLAGPDQRVTMRADMYDAGRTPGAQSSTTVTTIGTNPGAQIWSSRSYLSTLQSDIASNIPIRLPRYPASMMPVEFAKRSADLDKLERG